ncbi:hypothetical protein NXC12_PD00367 (plasmid) [Rhizobium etli]|uniref:Uncharacterized protein n=1 Tax=Rhizobium etli TaxID=29449 RepID=A0AAN1BLI4_RHIET|nr:MULTISPECIES: hypothetical protein [Rhizobium]ARO32479.1 hypothetical protein NXC14_PA00201 [Rhizobium sp. NXC14]ARQ13459.1 hypothetical protein NXC12_PD00367 [Rhizobium etli]
MGQFEIWEKFIQGSDDPDTLIGSDGDDLLWDYGGNDWIDGRARACRVNLTKM